MPRVLDERNFKRAGFSGNISKEDFKEALNNVSSDDEVAVAKIAKDFSEIKAILLNINSDLNDANVDKIKAVESHHKELNKNIDSNMKTISEKLSDAISELDGKLGESHSNDVWRFTVERDNFGSITSLTATREK